jgi:DNA-binding NarL/FixJ family response regulator
VTHQPSNQILVVDDDLAVQLRLTRVVERVLPGVGFRYASSLREARACLEREGFARALVDVNLPDGSGLELLAWMRAHAPQVESVVVSSLGDDATVLEAIRAGAVGYLLKNGSDEEMEMALASMGRGGAPIDPVIARRILSLMARPAQAEPPRAADKDAASLTGRELDVLQCVARGQSNREIARELGLSINTVECHAKNIYRKLSARSRSAAVFNARSQGLLP